MKKKLIIIIVIIISLLLIIVGIAINPTKKEKPKEEDIPKEITTEEYDNVRNSIFDEISNVESYLIEEIPIIDIDSLSNEKKTKYILDLIYSQKHEKKIKKEAVIKESKKHFINVELYEKSIKENDKILYNYNSGVYERKTSSTSTCKLNKTIEDDQYNKDTWTVKERIYFIKIDLKDIEKLNYVVEVYKSYEDCINSNNKLIKKDNNIATITTEEYDSIKEKLSVYNYSFINKNGRFYLKSTKSE